MITYDDLLAEAESVIRKSLERFGREPDRVQKAMHRDFANGAYLMWSAAAFKMAVKLGDSAITSCYADRARIEALIDSTVAR